MSGLNEGLELDDELEDKIFPTFSEILFQDPTPGEVPEIDDDTNIVTVVNGLKDLHYLHTDIVKSKGMCAGFALEAERIMPGFLNEDRPVGFFTRVPTKTLYQVSLEAIEAERKSLLQRIWEAIQVLVKQAREWLNASIQHLTNNPATAQAQKFYSRNDRNTMLLLENITNAYADVEATLKKTETLVSDKTATEAQAYHSALKTRLAKAEERFNDLYDQLNTSDELYALLMNSELVDRIMKVASHSRGSVQSLVSLTEAAAGVVSDAGHSSVAEAVERIKGSLGQLSHSSQTYEQLSRTLKLDLGQRMAKITPQTLPLPKLLERARTVLHRADPQSFLHSLGKLRDELETLQATSAKLTLQSAATTDKKAEHSQGLQEIFQVLNGELRGLVHVVKAATELFTAWLWLAKALESFMDDYVKRIAVHLKDLDAPSQAAITKYFGLPEAA